MTRTRIHNEDWGFETNCYVCEPKNSRGLQIPFFHDDETNEVVAAVTLSNDYSGAPTVVHGGVTLAVLDEAQAWACIALAKRFAVTAETTTRFHGAVYVDKPHEVRARIVESNEYTIRTAGQVLDMKGRVRAESTATFTPIGPAHFRRVSGADVTEAAAAYLPASHHQGHAGAAQ